MAPPSSEQVGRVMAAMVGLLGGGAVGFWMQVRGCVKRAQISRPPPCSASVGDEPSPPCVQKKMIDEERAARTIRLKARLERLKVSGVA